MAPVSLWAPGDVLACVRPVDLTHEVITARTFLTLSGGLICLGDALCFQSLKGSRGPPIPNFGPP